MVAACIRLNSDCSGLSFDLLRRTFDGLWDKAGVSFKPGVSTVLMGCTVFGVKFW